MRDLHRWGWGGEGEGGRLGRADHRPAHHVPAHHVAAYLLVGEPLQLGQQPVERARLKVRKGRVGKEQVEKGQVPALGAL